MRNTDRSITSNMVRLLVVFFCVAIYSAAAVPQAEPENDDYMHPDIKNDERNLKLNPEEMTAEHWKQRARETISEKLNKPLNTNVAKNIIMFLGDGLSIPTLKAARIYNGNFEDTDGEGYPLSFEKFPYAGLSKTYCLDRQVPDSACTATAYLCGVKAIYGTIGVNGNVLRNDCEASLNEANHVDSIAKWALDAGKKVGLVTTARITHASPAGTYAHTANRDWEAYGNGPAECPDIAFQLIHGDPGQDFDIILGGGRRAFIPNTATDEEGSKGVRQDGRNLIEEWLEKNGPDARYVWNVTDLLSVPQTTQKVLGLFESSHLKYHLDITDFEKEPVLEQLTYKAIEFLQKSENGYFLFIEGGRIDHAHHDSRAHRALDETREFAKAIATARAMTSEDDTLIVVTSDHSHVMTVSGYASRGNNIFGTAGRGADNIPYLTLSYANGPGHRSDEDGVRYDPTEDDTFDDKYRFPALAPLTSETHGGDDVGIFASGPWEHLFSGVLEQNVIPISMAFAACIGDEITACDSH